MSTDVTGPRPATASSFFLEFSAGLFHLNRPRFHLWAEIEERRPFLS